MKPAALLAAVLLLLVAVAHLLRLFFRVEIVADGMVIPLWVSVFAVVIPSGLALWIWKEQRN